MDLLTSIQTMFNNPSIQYADKRVSPQEFSQIFAEEPVRIDLSKIFQIESSNNPKAYNAKSGARGLGQIREPVLTDWNKSHKDEQYKQNDLFNAMVNQKISDWYYNSELPRLLTHYKIPDTVENRLGAYNFGIGNLVKGRPLPTETKNYIKKYLGE